MPKLKSMLILDDIVDDVIDAIKSKAHTGQLVMVDFISQVDEVIRIRTGEKGKDVYSINQV